MAQSRAAFAISRAVSPAFVCNFSISADVDRMDHSENGVTAVETVSPSG
jgi:hypothetical protein